MPKNLTQPRPLPAEAASRLPARPAAGPYPGGSRPYWRVLLEARWQVRLQQLTELSLAFHDAAAAAGTSGAGCTETADPAQHLLRDLMRRAVAARRALADIEEALARLAAGAFGRCEQCAADIPVATLARNPEARYCPSCSPAATADMRCHAGPGRAGR